MYLFLLLCIYSYIYMLYRDIIFMCRVLSVYAISDRCGMLKYFITTCIFSFMFYQWQMSVNKQPYSYLTCVTTRNHHESRTVASE